MPKTAKGFFVGGVLFSNNPGNDDPRIHGQEVFIVAVQSHFHL